MEIDLFEINFTSKKISIHDKYSSDEYDDRIYESDYEFNFTFIDKDESMLVCINEAKLEYLYIHRCIAKFTTKHRIKHYYPSSKSSGFEGPYAKDVDGNYYLFRANVIIAKIPKRYECDPYKYYHDKLSIMSSPDGRINYNNIGTVYMNHIDGPDKIYLNWDKQPKKSYKRNKKNNTLLFRIINESEDDELTKHDIISKKEYVDIMKKFGKEKGLKYLKMKVIYDEHVIDFPGDDSL